MSAAPFKHRISLKIALASIFALGPLAACSGNTETTDTNNQGSTGDEFVETGAYISEDHKLMASYGKPCKEASDCADVLQGETVTCLTNILKTYDLPGGYCSKLCALPDQQTTYITNAADCGGGANCIGLQGYFEGCAMPCTSNDQCPREGYECRTMPTISNPDDPKYCLMLESYLRDGASNKL